MSGFTLPSSRRISQAWGAEFTDFDGDGIDDYPQGFYHMVAHWFGHNGIDYACNIGDTVEAVADGIVEFAGWGDNDDLMTYGGNCIRITHPDEGVRSGYLHMSELHVSAGDTVTKGQVIGLSGATGTVTAPHLHLEFYGMGVPNQNDGWRGRIDPTPYLYGNEDDLVAISDDDAQKIAGFIWNFDYKTADGRAAKPLWLLQSMDAIIRETIAKTAAATAQVVLSTELPNILGGKTSLGIQASWLPADFKAVRDGVAKVEPSEAPTIDPVEFERLVREGITAAIAGLEITLTAGQK